MLFEGSPDLEKFISAYLQRSGALAEQESYALLDVLLPEELSRYFGEDQLRLAFDYEVAAENQGSLFITHGSPFVDKAVDAVLQNYGRLTTRFWSGPLPDLPRNFTQKALAGLDFRRCRPPKVCLPVVEECIFFGFNFRCVFRSHEKREDILTVVLNGSTGQVQTRFAEARSKNVPAEEREYVLAPASTLPLDTLYQIACREAEQGVQLLAEKIIAQGAGQKKKELTKIAGYYNEMTLELRKKIVGTADLKKRERLELQLAATSADRERREKDTVERYGVEVDIRLDHLVAHYVPCIWVKLEISHKDQVLDFTVLYNPLLGEIEAPVCASCEKKTLVLVPEKKSFVCPQCG